MDEGGEQLPDILKAQSADMPHPARAPRYFTRSPDGQITRLLHHLHTLCMGGFLWGAQILD
jgi:hypothetical protein